MGMELNSVVCPFGIDKVKLKRFSMKNRKILKSIKKVIMGLLTKQNVFDLIKSLLQELMYSYEVDNLSRDIICQKH